MRIIFLLDWVRYISFASLFKKGWIGQSPDNCWEESPDSTGHVAHVRSMGLRFCGDGKCHRKDTARLRSILATAIMELRRGRPRLDFSLACHAVARDPGEDGNRAKAGKGEIVR